MTQRWRCALASLASVDDGIHRLVRTLKASGELSDTLLVFMSDNGYFFGEHRLEDDKRLPYSASSRVPLAIVPPGPSASAPDEVREVVGTIDLAPTLLDYAGAEPCLGGGGCRELDGRSLRPLLEGTGEWPRDRGVLLELDDGFTYEAIRTPRHLYSELRGDRFGPLSEPEAELYDLSRDPNELSNALVEAGGAAAQVEVKLRRRLDALRACSGTNGSSASGSPCE